MIVVKDILGFIKKSDDFVLQNPKKAILYSIAFKIIGLVLLVIINSCYPIVFALSSLWFFSASLYIDYKILKNIELLVFQFIEKCINCNPEKAGFYLGRIFCMVMNADPASRARGIYRGFFFQRDN